MYEGNFGNYGFNYNRQPINADERIWVPNQQAAESYLVAPGGFVRLWDSNSQMFYERRADASGRPYPMDVYKYEKVLPQMQEPVEDTNNLIIEQLNVKINELTARIEQLENSKKGVKSNAKSNADDVTA